MIDTSTHTLIARVPLSGELQRPMGGVASRDGKFVYMTTGRGKTVAIIDVGTNRHVGSIEAGERPWGIAISADGKWLFTANGPSHDVSIIDVNRRVGEDQDQGRRRAMGRAVRAGLAVKSVLLKRCSDAFVHDPCGRCRVVRRSPLSSIWPRKAAVRRRKAGVGARLFPHNSGLRVIQR